MDSYGAKETGRWFGENQPHYIRIMEVLQVIEKVKIESREQWLEERKNSIGGSEIGAILGLNKWSTPYSVWANKLGMIPNAEPNESMRQGTDLEDYVAKRFAEASGFKICKCNYLLRNPVYPHLHATIDRKILGLNAGLECKTASAYNADKFTDNEFPESYYAQCVSYMAICGFEEYFLAALVLGTGPFKIYHLTTRENAAKPDFCDCSVYVSPTEFKAIRDTVEYFWRYVETKTPPPIDGEDATTEAINTAYPGEVAGLSIDLYGTEDKFDRIAELDNEIGELEKERDAIKNEIKERMGDAETGTNTKYTVTWKTQTSNRFQTKDFVKAHPEIDVSPFYKTSTSRVLRIKAQTK